MEFEEGLLFDMGNEWLARVFQRASGQSGRMTGIVGCYND